MGRVISRMLHRLHRTFVVPRIQVHAWLYNNYVEVRW